MFSDIFEPDYGVDTSPPDDTRIVQVILYFNEADAAQVRALAKDAMKRMLPDSYIEKGNLSDLFLTLLKQYQNEGTNNHSAAAFI